MIPIKRYIVFTKFANFVLHKDILTVFILKYYLNMELIDTPNPNAKKILVEHSYEVATYINKENKKNKKTIKENLDKEKELFNYKHSLSSLKSETEKIISEKLCRCIKKVNKIPSVSSSLLLIEKLLKGIFFFRKTFCVA